MQQGVFFLLLLLQLLFLCSRSNCEESYFLSNETQHHLNELHYSHEITIREDEAEFIFILHNVTHANESLGITSYFISITFIDKEHYEEQLPIVEISSNTSEYHGRLTMMYLEEEGNYLVCVFFLNPSLVFTSSRFCHVVSVANTCQLEVSEGTFNNRHAIILVAGALLLLIIIVIVTQIKSYHNRPRTMADRMKQFPASHTEKLQELGTMVDERRRRRQQPLPHELDDQLEDDLEPTVDHEQETDDQYKKYFAEQNASFRDDP